MARRPTGTRQRVLDAATVVFARRGYSGASVDELLRATGLSKPTLYYYFRNKEGLFRAILDFAYDESYRRMAEAASKPGTFEERATAVVAALFRFALDYSETCRLVLGATFAAPEEVPPHAMDPLRRRRAFDLFTKLVRDGRRSAALSSSFTAPELARGLLGIAMHQVRVHLLAPRGRLDARCARRTVALFLDGARRRP